jgi:hypothetical protein
MTESIYEVIENGTIKRTDPDGKEWFIPVNPANTDYQEYLASLEATEPEAE